MEESYHGYSIVLFSNFLEIFSIVGLITNTLRIHFFGICKRISLMKV